MKQEQFRIPLRILALVCGLFLSLGAMAQITVSGNVKDDFGDPLPGAKVQVVGQEGGTTTDNNGNFTIKAPQGASIAISYIGFQTVTVKAAPRLVITMQDDTKMLEDVVVIGYGTVKKTDLTGSVVAIRPDEKNHGLNTNAQDMLSGKIAGVNVTSYSGKPGENAQIRIRGGSSLNASNNPLIVIDGLALDDNGRVGSTNPLAMVNPNDIESFTVLKDASATAIYGSRASNGVIIITTKKGQKGQGLKVSYNGNVSISTNKKTLEVMNGPAYTDFIKNLYGEDSDAYRALGWRNDAGEQILENTDWQKEIYRTAVSHDHNVTLTGAAKHMPYRVSLGYTNQQGIIKTSDFERYTASFNLSPSLLDDHLTFNINGKGMVAKEQKADEGAIGAARWMDPTKPVTASNSIYNQAFGGYVQWYQDANFSGETYADTEGGAAVNHYPYQSNRQGTANPVALLDLKDQRVTSKTLTGNIEADYKIHGLEDLHLHVNGAMDLYNGKQEDNISPFSSTNNYYGYIGWNDMKTYNLQLSAYAQYLKSFNDKHDLNVMAGYEWQHYHIATDWNGSGFYPETNPTMGGQTYDAPLADQVTKYESENYLVSFFGRVNYSLLNRYLFTATVRDDGSSRFRSHWALFPSAAFAWKINEESFLKDSKTVSDLKLRLGWGKTGQQEGIGDYSYIPVFTPNQNHAFYPLMDNGGITYRPDAYNRDLKWESTTTYNAGIDLGFLKNRLTFNLDWYYRKTTDLINEVYVPAGSNFKPRVNSNIGELHNTGFEFATTVRPIVTKDWYWEINYNFTYNHNEIDKLTNGYDPDYFVETGGISAGVGGNVQAHHVGNAASAFHVYQQVYGQDGNPIPNTYVDRNGNGIIDSGDRYYYYKPAPDVTMGLASRLQYKKWDLGFSLRASLGNYVYNDNYAGSYNVGSGSVWTVGFLGNRLTDAVALGFTNPLSEQVFSDYYVENASFLKMDNITLGYSFDGLFKGAKYKGISGRVYATVQNVFTITKYSGLDPEVASGIDQSLYPRPLTSIVGLSLNF